MYIIVVPRDGKSGRSWEFGDFWCLGVRLPNNFWDKELEVERKIFPLRDVESGVWGLVVGLPTP